MKSIAELALQTYYVGTLPLRAGLRQRLAATGQAPVCVLFYHRVADSQANDWTISNAQFRNQMRWLQDHFPLVSLAEAQAPVFVLFAPVRQPGAFVDQQLVTL